MAIPAGVELKCWSYQPSQMKQLRSSSKNMHFKQGLLGREMFKPADRRWTLILMILNLISVLLWTIDDPYSGFQSWTMKTYFLGQRFALTMRKSARRSRTRFGLTCMIFWFRTYWKDICLKIGYPQFQWSIIIIPFIYIYIHMYTHIQAGGYRILYLMFTHIWWDNKYSSFFSLSCSGKRFRRTVALLWGDGNSPCPCCDAGSHHWGIFVDAQVGHIGWCGPHARRFFGLFANSVSREHATSTINLGSLCWTQRDAYFWIRVNCKTV